MNLWKRQGRLFGLVTSIILVLLLSACGSSGPTTTTTTTNGTTTTTTQLKIMVGGLSKQIYLPNKLTQQLGYFKQEGLDVTLIDEASGQSSEDEVLAGQVDAGSGSYNHTIELQPKGKQMEAVVLLNIAPGEAEIVSAKAASQIHSVKDLKGKNLGVTELGSGTQTLTTALLHNAGITTDQVHFVPVGAGDTSACWATGCTGETTGASSTTWRGFSATFISTAPPNAPASTKRTICTAFMLLSSRKRDAPGRSSVSFP